MTFGKSRFLSKKSKNVRFSPHSYQQMLGIWYFGSSASGVHGPNHWAISAQQKCLSRETLSLANPGRGVPMPAGAFSASKIAYPRFFRSQNSDFLCFQHIIWCFNAKQARCEVSGCLRRFFPEQMFFLRSPVRGKLLPPAFFSQENDTFF